MKLTSDEKRMLDGGSGPGVQRAMELLVAVGDAYEAERMVDATSSHILSPELQFWSTGKLGRWVKELTKESIEGVHRFKIPTTINPLFLTAEVAEKIGFPAEYIEEMQQTQIYGIDAYRSLGVIPTYTCCPFYLHAAHYGEHLGGAESVAVLFYNSVFGAMVNRESGPTALAIAITGKTPCYGMHVPENRRAQVVVKIKDDLDPGTFTYADYNALSYFVGGIVVDKIPVYSGLPSSTTLTQLKYLCVPLGVSAGLPMMHAAGITPEAPTVEAALGNKKPAMTIEIGAQELRDTYEALCSARDEKVNYVLLGCPHTTVEETREIAHLLQGKKVSDDVLLLVGTSEPLRLLAQQMGLVDIIEKAGGLVVSGICSAGSFLRRNVPSGFSVGVAATNAAKAAHYLKVSGVQCWFGTMKQCVNAAINGKWEFDGK